MPRLAMASDCDETLFFRKRIPTILSQDIEAVRNFRAGGGLFGICTGRPYYGVLDAVGDQLRFDFHICTSGAHILGSSGETLCENKLPRSTAASLWKMGKSLPFMVVQANGRLYSPHPTSPFQIFVSEFDEIPGDSIFGVSFYVESQEKAAEMADMVNREWSGTACAFHNSICLDVVSHSVSKGRALIDVRQRLDIGCMAAIGDSFNDLPMLRAADISFTFPYAPEELRKAATHVVPTVGTALEMLEGNLTAESKYS